MGVERLDDHDYPALTIGQAADLLGVAPAFLRSLDAADLLHPHRSPGGQRRYSRRQVEFAGHVHDLAEEGNTVAGAASILTLRSDLAAAHDQLDDARAERDRARADLARAHHDLARAQEDLDQLRGDL